MTDDREEITQQINKAISRYRRMPLAASDDALNLAEAYFAEKYARIAEEHCYPNEGKMIAKRIRESVYCYRSRD